MKKAMKLVLLLLLFSVKVVKPQAIQPTCNYEYQITKFVTPTYEDLVNGYCDVYGYSVPGVVKKAFLERRQPDLVVGSVTWYAPLRMEQQFPDDKIPDQYLDGVAVMNCIDAGSEFYLTPPGGQEEGVYYAEDCANPNEVYPAVCFKNEVLEIGYTTAVRWGMVQDDTPNDGEIGTIISRRLDGVVVRRAGVEIPQGTEPKSVMKWWLEGLEFTNGIKFADLPSDICALKAE